MHKENNLNRLFYRVTAYPRIALAAAMALIMLFAAGLGQLTKDTSIEAFIPPGHPSTLADEKVRDIFGLSDTMAIAVVANGSDTVFSTAGFALILELSDQLAGVPNIRPDTITSLATESSISGDGTHIDVATYLDPSDLDTGSIAASRQRWEAMAPHRGTLVSEDGDAAIIMAEIGDPSLAADTYEQILALTQSVESTGFELHVAGPGAVSGFLSRYIDQDARKLQPLVFALVLGFIFLAFGRLRALPGPLLVVAGSAAGALGIMAWAGIAYYAITSALPVIIVAISVADAIHVLSAYYQRREQRPDRPVRDLVVDSMVAMARPITLTTLTTIAGFAGIALVSIMPPITWFAVFAAIGVALAWLFSILVLPNVLVLLDPGRSRAFRSWQEHRPSPLGRALAALGAFSPLRYKAVLAGFLVVAGIAVFGASELRIDRSQVENFAADEPIRIADEVMNSRFAGTAFLDVIVETDELDGLLRIDRMRKIESLQQFFVSLPHVQKTVSIVDYLGELHRALNGDEASPDDARSLPDSDEAIAQYLFLYEVSGDPTDFDEEIDADYQTALVRGVLNAHYFSQTREVVEALEAYIEREFNEPGFTATLAGDVNVGYHWMESLKQSHFSGVGLSLLLVLAMSIVVFRSVLAGVIAVVPVVFTVLMLYAFMGFAGIYLEPATSMFAAIALGVGVDFGIHLVDRLRSDLVNSGGDIARTIDTALPPVARACFFNSAALGIGFAVLLASDLPTLQRFGGLIALATLTSFIVALMVVPALFALIHSRFVTTLMAGRPSPTTALAAVVVILATITATDAFAGDAAAIAQRVADRPEGQAGTRVIEMTLTNRRDRTERRRAIVHKESSPELRKTRITFVEPKRSRDFAFLSHDYLDDGASDDRWMFIPVERKVRRIPASSRGDSFFGTDLSFDDVQSEFKFNVDEWEFEYLGEERAAGAVRHRIAGTPKSPRIARELRYGSFTAVIDAAAWMPVRIEFADTRNRPLKTIEVPRIEQIEGIWTAREILAVNHQTGHRTRFVLSDIDYIDDLPNEIFSAQNLSRDVAATAGE